MSVSIPNLSYADLLRLILADIAKAPLLISDVQALKADTEKLLADAGIPIPWAAAGVQLTPHSAETLDLEERAIEAHKLGDGSILRGIGTFLQSPLGQQLLGLLLGQLLPKPAA